MHPAFKKGRRVWKSCTAIWGNLTWQQVVMWAIGGLLVYLAIAKDMEPTFLLPMDSAQSW